MITIIVLTYNLIQMLHISKVNSAFVLTYILLLFAFSDINIYNSIIYI